MATWELYRDGDSTTRGFVVPELIDVKYIDSANPFGDRAICQLEDRKGLLFDLFEFGTRIELFVTPDGGSEIRKFVGFMVEKREYEQNGQDQLEIIAHTFDQFLRQNDVSEDQTGKLISDAVQDIVSDDTPISVGAANISVIDDFKIQRSLQDFRVNEALRVLSFLSGNESFGVDDNKNFFFEQKESDTVSRGISDTQWFNYDIPERGKEAINEVEVRFNNGDNAVVIDNAQQKLQLDDSLDLIDPATKRARINRPTIKSVRDAEIEGRRFLKLKNVTLTGTVTTFQLYEAEPGDTIDIEITDRGIDSEFIITKIQYHWARDETTLTIVENRGFDSDLIVRLEEKTERIDLRGTEPSAAEARVISTEVSAEVNGELEGNFSSVGGVTNSGVDAIADAWASNQQINSPELVIGTGDTPPSRSDSSLDNQTARISGNRGFNFPSIAEATFTSSRFSASGITEIGVKDASDRLLCRFVTDNAQTFNNESSVISFTVSESTDNNGTMTREGLTVIRDIIANNSPAIPDQYAVGGDRPIPRISDTSLSNLVSSTSLDRKELQSFTELTDFFSVLNSQIPPDSPLTFNTVGDVTTDAVCYPTEAENAAKIEGQVADQSQVPGDLSNGEGVQLDAQGEFVRHDFTLNQAVPSGKLAVGIFVTYDNFRSDVEFRFNGTEYQFEGYTGGTQERNVEGFTGDAALNNGVNQTRLESGTVHSLKVKIANPVISGRYIVDALYAYDIRDEFNISTPASASAANPSFSQSTNSYQEPELFPEEVSFTLPEVSTLRDITELEVTQDRNDVVGSSVTLRIGSTSKTFQPSSVFVNTINETLSVSSSQADNVAQCDVTLSRGNDLSDDSFPATGDLAQVVKNHRLEANVQAINRSDIGQVTLRTSFGSGALSGFPLKESGQRSGSDLLTHSIFSTVNPGSDNIVPAERLTFIPK
jgi:hypothetical protein